MQAGTHAWLPTNEKPSMTVVNVPRNRHDNNRLGLDLKETVPTSDHIFLNKTPAKFKISYAWKATQPAVIIHNGIEASTKRKAEWAFGSNTIQSRIFVFENERALCCYHASGL